MTTLDELGNRIRAQRKKQNLKQDDIARALQISPQAVSKWERGENAPDLFTLAPLGRLLGVSVDWLLGTYQENLDVFDATVFVSSVQGAYEKSRQMDARSFATWANGLFYQVTEAVLRFDALPIKYMGDEFLCFFSGVNHLERALEATKLAKQTTEEKLAIGLSTGEVYLGSIGHPDYARADIVSETVNIAFLTMNWADENSKSACAMAGAPLPESTEGLKCLREIEVGFKSIPDAVLVREIEIPQH